MLVVEPQDKVERALWSIVKGIPSRTIRGGREVIKLLEMAAALCEVGQLADNILDKLTTKLEQEHGDEIRQSKLEVVQEVPAPEEQPSPDQSDLLPPPMHEAAEPSMRESTFQEALQRDLGIYYEKPASDITHVCSVLSTRITSRITSQIQHTVVRPVTTELSRMAVDKVLEKAIEAVRQSEKQHSMQVEAYHRRICVEELLAKKGTRNNTVTEEDASPAINSGNRTMADKVRSGSEAGKAEAEVISLVLGRPMQVYDENNQLLVIVGEKHSGRPIKVRYMTAEDGTSGHYEPYDKRHKVTVSGKNNCLYDAVSCQTGKVETILEKKWPLCYSNLTIPQPSTMSWMSTFTCTNLLLQVEM